MKGVDTSSKDAREAGPARGGFAVSGTGAGVVDLAPRPFRETRYGWLVLGAVWVVCAAYLALHLREGWTPHDPGTMGYMAERVLHGQLPHRDFVEVYTGGLDYLNALAFWVFGVNFLSLRIPLFLFFLGWVPSVYFIARRFAGPLAAGAVTLLSVAWSVPTYPEAMPSWYNLFFATWGLLALLRFTESEKKRWLWVAGLCGGLSFLAKVIGLYFVAAALLFFVFREALDNRVLGARSDGHSALPYRLFVTAGLLAFLVGLIDLVSSVPAVINYVHFVLPSACLVALLLWLTWREESDSDASRFRRLLGMGLPFIAGFFIPVFVFLLWFVEKGALAAWFHGTFVAPTARFLWARGSLTPLGITAGLIPFALVVLLALDPCQSSRRLVRVAAPAGLAALLFAAWKSQPVYMLIGFSLPLLVPIVALFAPFAFHWTREHKSQKVFLTVTVAVLCALVQFPASAAIYFNYVAPLVILALLALISTRASYERLAIGSLLAFYLAFAVWLRTPGYRFETRARPGESVASQRLDLSRAGGLQARKSDAEEYEELVPLVEAHSRGPYIYCTPDCPQIYFLSGKRNPTRTIYEFLEPGFLDFAARTESTLRSLDSHAVSVVVLHTGGGDVFSGPIPPDLRTSLDSLFPSSRRVGHFLVRWR